MILRRTTRFSLLALAAGLCVSACQPYRNFTTYFNLFYNIERLSDEVENEMAWMRDQKTPDPVYLVPYDESTMRGAKVYNHLDRRSTSEEEMRANKIKLDSILIKGSKLLARDAKSDYVDGAVFYIGKAYFYLHEWFQSQKKCEELIANFPNSKYSPDGHLYLSMDMMRQGNVDGARTMLSRTVDVAWAQKRLDVLVDAFRLNADLELGEGDVEKAIKPYRRAMILSSDDEDRARWEYEIGAVYFRNGSFDDALREFNKVSDYSPDTFIKFETGLQRAVTLRVLGKYDEAAKQLADLRSNGNFDLWYGLVDVERNNLASERPDNGQPRDTVATDTSSTAKNYAAYGVYEHAVRAFRSGDYRAALDGFTRVQAAVAPFQRRAQRYVTLLNQYFRELVQVQQATRIPLSPFPDSTKAQIADNYYNVARVFSTIDKPDSLRRYYALSLKWAPQGSPQAARALYATSQLTREDGHTTAADSLLEILVQQYGLTEYAADARARLGYTENAKIDTAEDLYVSGMAHMRIREDSLAITQFQRVTEGYPASLYAPKAYYAIGLLYEQQLNNRDSAFAYYARILERYPNSDQATAVKPIIAAVLAARQKGDTARSGGSPGAAPNSITVPQPGNGNPGLMPRMGGAESGTTSSPTDKVLPGTTTPVNGSGAQPPARGGIPPVPNPSTSPKGGSPPPGAVVPPVPSPSPSQNPGAPQSQRQIPPITPPPPQQNTAPANPAGTPPAQGSDSTSTRKKSGAGGG